MSYAPSPAALEKIEGTIALYPEKPAALLPVLHIIQGESGFISAAAEAWAAAKLGLRPVRVREVLSFYTMFRRAPAGRTTLQVCRNLSCALAGAGATRGAPPPSVRVGAVPHGPVTRETVAALIEELKAHV